MGIEITKQPVSVTALEKASVSFSVEVTGDGLTYQWKQSSNGRSWSNSTLASAKKPTLTMSASINRQGYYFRCVITDSSGNTVTSNSARLTVLYISITKQPSSVEAKAGSRAMFTVGASGDDLVYQWQYKAPDMTDYANTTQAGYNTNTLTVAVTAELNEYKYRCFITDAVGNQKASSAATLTVLIEKRILSRLVDKHDIEANWVQVASFIPMQGEVIIYDVDDNYNYERFKVGDGITSISSLPFINDVITVDEIMAICQ